MATSRTGTTRHLKNVAAIRAAAIQAGITNCPLCQIPLDYERPRLPNSAEVDHKIPVARGGSDERENLWVICRGCNGRKGGAIGLRRSARTGRRPHPGGRRRSDRIASIDYSSRW